jgi:2-isopropylmalate synthase
MSNQGKIIILDTTLRDGEQTPGVNLNLSEKLEIARLLEALGVDIIEAGFPAASPGDFETVRVISQSVGCAVTGLCRCVPGDIEKGWNAVKYSVRPRIHIVLATSDLHLQYKLRMSREEALRRAVEGTALAKSMCADVEFSCEDASRSDPAYLREFIAAILEAGATTVSIPDTVGYAMPMEYGGLVRELLAAVPGLDKAVLSVHCHDDLGLAVANTLSGIQNGARQIETTVNGLGERAGNCSMEEVVMALSTRSGLYPLSHGIDTTKIYRTSQRVSKITGIAVPVGKAIVGANAFSHESGIHQHGVLANPMTYEIMTPQSVGKASSTMTLGKLSGRHAFVDRLESMGYALTPDEVDLAFAAFKSLADRKKRITDDDLEAIVATRITDVPDYYKLDMFQIQSGNRMLSMASVTLVHNGEAITEAATGDGPVDAACNAAMRIVGGDWPMTAYDIKAVTEGMDALGEVTVRVSHDGRSHTGRGLSTDVIEASILAYINAINRALAAAAKAEE